MTDLQAARIRISELEQEVKALEVSLKLFAEGIAYYPVWHIAEGNHITTLYADKRIDLCMCNGSLHISSMGCL